MECLQKFHSEKTDLPAISLTEEQKALVDAERAKCKNDPNYLLDWEKVMHTIKA